MKRHVRLGILIFFAAGCFWTRSPERVQATVGPNDLQSLADQAAPGGTVILEAGTYAGPLTIDKPLALKAAVPGTVTLRNESGRPALSIHADSVSVSGIVIIDEEVKEAPTVQIRGDHFNLEELIIRTGSDGIAVRDADDGEISRTRIEWGADGVRTADKGNGIDLYNAHRVRLNGNHIVGVHDGIYLENSDETAVIQNRIEASRYGIHSMYTVGTVIRNNEGIRNVTGAMVMASRKAKVDGNTFVKQYENVHSQGILLYDVHESSITDNRVEGNRVGLYAELSTENRMERNRILYNFVGIQLLDASKNRISDNLFLGNAADAEAQGSSDNELIGNYWDAFRGIDADGDGRSDIGYAIHPFFQGLTAKQPAFQLFFQSPGFIFLENLFQSDRSAWTKDMAPQMNPPASADSVEAQASDGKTAAAGAIMTGIAMISIIWTRSRRT